VEDLTLDHAREGALAEAVHACPLEGLVEVRAAHAGRAGALERVAGAAFRHERLLPGDEVVAVVLELAARDAHEQGDSGGNSDFSSPHRSRNRTGSTGVDRSSWMTRRRGTSQGPPAANSCGGATWIAAGGS
jgi:hypothetical protein